MLPSNFDPTDERDESGKFIAMSMNGDVLCDEVFTSRADAEDFVMEKCGNLWYRGRYVIKKIGI